MSNRNEIDNILQYFAEIARSNPNLRFNCDDSEKRIYHKLVFTGVKPEDQYEDLSNLPSKMVPNLNINPEYKSYYCHPDSTFNNWIQLYAKRPTQVFVDPKWRYFCQFISQNPQARQSTEHLKLYIPLDANHVEYGAKMIFDFLEQQNIPHLSKVGKAIRFDNIVIRLVNPNDLDKVITFVKNNQYLQEGLIQPNPFAFQKDGLAMAVDGSLSFNSTIAQLIDIYIDNCRRTNKLNMVNHDDFYSFVYQKYKGQFIDKNDNTLQNSFGWRDSSTANNYQQVIRLAINVQNPNFTYKNFLEHYASCAGVQLEDQRTIAETDAMLIEALKAMTLRFNHPTGLYNVEGFFHSGQPTLITSKNGLRARMINSNFRQALKTILEKNNMSFMQYAQQLLNKNGIDLAQLDRGKTLN